MYGLWMLVRCRQWWATSLGLCLSPFKHNVNPMKLAIEIDPETGIQLHIVNTLMRRMAKKYPGMIRIREIPEALYERYQAAQAERESVHTDLIKIFRSQP